jgi:hypothetical protein
MTTSDYKAYGSFTGIYREARHALYDTLYADKARQAECVLNAMAEHCNPVGTCFVKVYRLMELTRYGEGTVRRSLLELSKLDYLREHSEYSVARQKELITWQISPRVVWISPGYIDMAEQLWTAAKVAASLYRNEMFNGQPESESLNQNQQPEPETRTSNRTTTTTYAETNKSVNPRGNPRTARNNPEPARSAETQDEVQPQQREAPKQHQKSVPPPVPLSLCRDPLDGYAETVAKRAADVLSTRIAQARQLVKQYDCQNVEAGLRWIAAETAAGKVEKPFGLLKWWLMSNAITPEDVPVEQQSTLSGQYSSYFER